MLSRVRCCYTVAMATALSQFFVYLNPVNTARRAKATQLAVIIYTILTHSPIPDRCRLQQPTSYHTVCPSGAS